MFIKNRNIAITIDLTSVGTTSTITVNKTANQVSAEIERIEIIIQIKLGKINEQRLKNKAKRL